jgi:hypothetical protein
MRPGEPFNPFRLFNGLFVREALARHRGLSPGAKLAYGLPAFPLKPIPVQEVADPP